jgi:hypothetical protein
MPVKTKPGNGTGTDVAAPHSSNVIPLDTLRASVGNYRATAPRVRGGGGYINFSKGEWSLGRERAPLDLNAVWLMNPATLQHGWICWRNSAIAHEVLLPIGTQLPAEVSLPPVPPPGPDEAEGYQYQIGFSSTCIEGPYTKDADNNTGHFKSSSIGGTGAIQKLIDDLNARMDECDVTGSEFYYPVIQFDTSFYNHKVRGKIWVPLINVVGFSDNDPSHEIEWLEEDEPAPPPVAPTKTGRPRRTAS